MALKEEREQLFLELINRDRLDPAAAGARYGVADLSAGTGTTITAAAKQPLAYNASLFDAASGHNAYLLANNLFTHDGQTNPDPMLTRLKSSDRIALEGYGTKTVNPQTGVASYNFGAGENLALQLASGMALDVTAAVYTAHQGLFQSAGHRKNILNALYEELGVSVMTDMSYTYNGSSWEAFMSTHNYAYKTTTPVFVTGVHYTDTDNNDFYSIGEANAGRTVGLYAGATLLASTTTAVAGGYQVQTAANGAVELVFSGGGLTGEKGVSLVLGSVNVKVDLTNSDTIESNVSAILTRSSANLTLIGIDNVNGTGNSLGNAITGNKGNNVLSGADGTDTLIGGDGNDTLNGGNGNDSISGGTGSDTAVFAGTFASYAFVANAAISGYTVYGPDGSVDTVTGVETFQFSDVSKTAAQLPLSSGPTRNVSVAASAASLVEGTGGASSIDFLLTLNGAATQNLTVNWVATGIGATIAKDTDFSGASSGTATFVAGSSQVTVTLQVNGDSTAEANENINFVLSAPSAGLTLGTATATTVILNDDPAPAHIVNGSDAADTLAGSALADQINGFAGNDILRGLSGVDVLDGGAGIDRATYTDSLSAVVLNLLTNINSGGDAEGDKLFSIENVSGSTKADTITGNNGNNAISGAAGADTLSGLGGNDRLTGGAHNDGLTGGTGADVFVYDSLTFGQDRIEDFENGIDKIDLAYAGLDWGDFTISQSGTDTLLTLSANSNHSIRLAGIASSSIEASDFI